jgi:hypothetical protein
MVIMRLSEVRETTLLPLRPSHLGGVVVNVLATGPKGCGFEPSQRDGFFKGDKNPQHTFLLNGK